MNLANRPVTVRLAQLEGLTAQGEFMGMNDVHVLIKQDSNRLRIFPWHQVAELDFQIVDEPKAAEPIIHGV